MMIVLPSLKCKTTFCFDCDGVLWRGQEPVPEARDLLIKLKNEGKTVKFITNSSVCTRAQHAMKIEKILQIPFEIDPNAVITSANVTANYLSKVLPVGSTIFLIGMEGIQLELQAVGFNVFKRIPELFNGAFGAVVVGYDCEFNYHSISDAITVFKTNPEALFIACNLDATFVGNGGKILPGTGSIVKCVAYASEKEPIVMGKPNNFIYETLNKDGFNSDSAVFIGDRLDSDIAFANRNNIFSILVESGVHKRSDVADIVPDLIISNLNDLMIC